MNALFIKVVALVVAVLSSGCVANWADPIGYSYSYGVNVDGYGGYGSPAIVRTTPCRPYDATGVMSWAKELSKEPAHSRSAAVTTYNGVVNCVTSENASSSMGRR